MIRPIVSTGPPAGNGTMIVMGREGKPCDSAGSPVNRIAASMTATLNRLPMRSFPVFPRSRVRSGVRSAEPFPHRRRDLVARRHPDIVTALHRARDGLIGPCAGGPAVTMAMGRDVDDDCLVLAGQPRGQRVVEQLDELPRRAAEAHRMRKIIDFHGERNRHDAPAVKALQVRTVVIEHVTLPLISRVEQEARRVRARRSARTDPAPRLLSGSGRNKARGLQDVLAVLVNRELRRNDFLCVSVRDDLVAGVRDRFYSLRNALGEHGTDHDTAPQLGTVKHAQQSLDAAHRAIVSPSKRIGIEDSAWQWISHRADPGGLAIRPTLECHVENDGDVPAAGPAIVMWQPLYTRPARENILHAIVSSPLFWDALANRRWPSSISALPIYCKSLQV